MSSGTGSATSQNEGMRVRNDCTGGGADCRNCQDWMVTSDSSRSALSMTSTPIAERFVGHRHSLLPVPKRPNGRKQAPAGVPVPHNPNELAQDLVILFTRHQELLDLQCAAL